MKHILSLLFILTFVVACGPTSSVSSSVDAQKSLLTATWCNQLNKKENLTITDDNGFFVTDYCQVTGTYNLTSVENFTVNVTYRGTVPTGANCITLGTHECTYQLSNNNNSLYMRCVISGYGTYSTTFLRGSCSN